MKKVLLSLAVSLLIGTYGFTQQFTYSHNPDEAGFTVSRADGQKVEVSYTIHSWSMTDMDVNREAVKKIDLPGHMLPNDEGAPDLPGKGRYIAIPQGATAQLNIISSQVEIISDVDISPAPRIPLANEDGPLLYTKNESLWSTDAFYPADPVTLSSVEQIRGMDVVMLGITPFQYNPVTRELKVYHDLEVEVSFEGGSGQFGDDRLRSRWWDPMLKDMVLNPSVISDMSYAASTNGNRDVGCEYLIIVPDHADFLAWADTLKVFRNKQGILTDVVTTTEIGGNSVAAIESYINNAYNTWNIVPAAVLLMGDYGTSGATIVSPIWDNYCASDNIFSDVSGNQMPDIVFSRMTAQNATHLETMVNKIISYETNPPTDPDFYNKPITALGWQTERWFQICIETLGGFFRNTLGKDPVRINEVYGGNPETDPWSTAGNTSTVLNYFGPNGLGYLPATPAELGNWDGGNPTMINNAINDGSFLLLHRDHGYEQGWGEPSYNNSSLNGLNNDELTFVYSVNCLTGKYNWSNECFTEKFHRHEQGALGLVAASEVSYSFVNDTYVWGAFDNMFPEFMPDYGSTPEPRGLLPAFSNAAGKYFLQQSNWPYNTSSKAVTYNLFHHHGGAFSTLYSEVPQDLAVVHNGVIMAGLNQFTVQADTGALVALSVDGVIIGTGIGTGMPETITIEPQAEDITVDLVITKTNYFRYEDELMTISPDEPYVIYEDHTINDSGDNGDGMMDYAESPMISITMYNLGNEDAQNIQTTLRSSDPYVVVTDSIDDYGLIPGNQSITTTDGFAIEVADSIPDQHLVYFDVEAIGEDTSWNSIFFIMGHAPVMQYISFSIDDASGDGNGRLDPGETADFYITIANNGTSSAYAVNTELLTNDPYLTINTGLQLMGDMMPGDSVEQVFSITADATTPGGYSPEIMVNITADHNVSSSESFSMVVGQFSALVLDLDPNNHSGPGIMEAFEEIELYAEYTTSWPNDIQDYKSLFLCLGIYYSNYVLTEEEAQLVVDYLNAGGSVYMEGRTTWQDSPLTSLHDMFNIDTVTDDWFQYNNIMGQEGTFTEGMDFAYAGVTPYNKYYLEAIEPAYVIFSSEESDYGCVVANETPTYKTIGASIEFTGLVDGDSPSTKGELLREYLNFFGGILTGTDELALEAEAIPVSVYPNPFRSELSLSFDVKDVSSAALEIFNASGQKIATLFRGQLMDGKHEFKWNGTDDAGNSLSQGLYFYRLSLGEQMSSGKIMLSR